jgi:tetratricopeptide (TPR) repeat protein
MGKVFISYSHDSMAHKEKVLALSKRLREDGIETNLDQYVPGTPRKGWPRWMLDQIDEAEYVLLVCTDSYYRRFRGREVPGKGKGADWEGAIITREIYDDRGATTKFVPIMFNPGSEQFIPEPVRVHTFYVLDSEVSYHNLYDFLLGQAGIEAGPVGEPMIKERKQVAPLTFSDTRSRGERYPQISPTRLSHGAEHLIGRENELAVLDKALDNPQIHIITIVAFGGVGKTSLVFEWMNRQSVKGWHGMERVFDWSFYSMVTRENRDASSDSFVKAALIFFGDRVMAESTASAWDKGERLASLVSEHPTLLVLDGLEPLQHPPGQQTGKLKDPTIETLLKGLARRNSGLCVVTTRTSIADLAAFRETTVTELPLPRLSTQGGVELLKHLGVWGNYAELDKLVEDVKGHALTINLLGRFLAEAYGGDIQKRDVVNLEVADEEIQEGHAFRVIEAYEKWFSGEKKEGKRLIAVLYILALFDRPADYGCIEELRKPPAIGVLTGTLVDQGKAKWNITLNRLSKCGLISLSTSHASPMAGIWSRGASLDTHPIIREYFAGKLRKQHMEAWKTGHMRLYDYLVKGTNDKKHPNLEDLLPLYQAIFHGCQAGIHERALREVYKKRIQKDDQYYSMRKLGAISANLAAVACFAERPWSKFSSSISVDLQGLLLNEAGICLRTLGRLSEALETMSAALDIVVQKGNWINSATGAINLSELLLLMGDVAGALRAADNSVDYSDLSGDKKRCGASRAIQGCVLHHCGHHSSALKCFIEAENIYAESDPKYPLLYSIPGFRYCDLLLDEPNRIAWRHFLTRNVLPATLNTCISKCHSVSQRAVQTINWIQDDQLSTTLDHLTQGRADLYAAILKSSSGDPGLANNELVVAVEGFRAASRADYLPLGLLSRAWLYYVKGDFCRAESDLDEAWEIAERSLMRLHMADILLYRARLFRDNGALKQARVMIENCGYWRRREELEDAEAAAKEWTS